MDDPIKDDLSDCSPIVPPNKELNFTQSDDSVVEIVTAGPTVGTSCFTLDGRFLLIATIRGFQIYRVDPTSNCVLEYQTDQRFSIGVIQRALSAAIVFYVSSNDPSNLIVEYYSEQTVLAKLAYYGPILSVQANHKIFTVLVNNKLFIYETEGLCPIAELNDVQLPSRSAFALAVDLDGQHNHIAYCLEKQVGHITVHSVTTRSVVTQISAHQDPINVMTFNLIGDLLATSSQYSTVIRIFKVPDGELIRQFRRGVTPTVIQSICFTPDDFGVLAVTDIGMVHFFQIRCCDEAGQDNDWTVTELFSGYLMESYATVVSAVTGSEMTVPETFSRFTVTTPLGGQQSLICQPGRHPYNYNLVLCTKLGELYVCRVNALKRTWYAGKSVSLAYESEVKRIHDLLDEPRTTGTDDLLGQLKKTEKTNPVEPRSSDFAQDNLLSFMYRPNNH